MSSLFDSLYSGLPGYPCAFSPDRRHLVLLVEGLGCERTAADFWSRRAKHRDAYDALLMMNAFAYRSTDPFAMKAIGHDAVGPENDEWQVRGAELATIVVAAWGVHGTFLGRDEQIRELLPDLWCFGTTKDGHPRHPLYLPSDVGIVKLDKK